MTEEKISLIIGQLVVIESDLTVPKNVRARVKKAIFALEDNNYQLGVKIDKALEELGEVDTDPNLSPFIRTQIWNVVSNLEGE